MHHKNPISSRNLFAILGIVTLLAACAPGDSPVIRDNRQVPTPLTSIVDQEFTISLLSFSTGSLNRLNSLPAALSQGSNVYNKSSFIKLVFMVEIPDDTVVNTINTHEPTIALGAVPLLDEAVRVYADGADADMIYIEDINCSYDKYHWSGIATPHLKHTKNSVVIEQIIHNRALRPGCYDLKIRFGINGKVKDYAFERVWI